MMFRLFTLLAVRTMTYVPPPWCAVAECAGYSIYVNLQAQIKDQTRQCKAEAWARHERQILLWC